MAQRRFHYERAFEHYLRNARIPYVAVDEAKKALLPSGATLRLTRADGQGGEAAGEGKALKNFDFMVYGESSNALVEIKGRKLPRSATRRDGTPSKKRLESWVSMDDVDSLLAWRSLFGPGFEAAIVFVYLCEDQPPDGLFDELIAYGGSWYTTRTVELDAYRKSMRVRSPRWRTMHLSTADFERLARPFAPSRAPAAGGRGERDGALLGGRFQGTDSEVGGGFGPGGQGSSGMADAGPRTPVFEPIGG